MNTRKVRAGLLVPVLALILAGTAGCAGGGGSPAPASSAPPGATATVSQGTGSPANAAVSITIKDFGYGAPVTVSPGATVAVTNMDSAAHTVTADEGSAFDVDVKGSGGAGTFTAPMQPGSYAYHCTFHPAMHGTLTVK
ncbi:cupredoxin domain-containing protein [Pseudarthrobacter sp. O4]|uniref:cupredoxin domain-containing protein n=1 Tax=Pseudarthrobacter sp. O4 TaxID=3418417 RepID=UPI003CF92261